MSRLHLGIRPFWADKCSLLHETECADTSVVGIVECIRTQSPTRVLLAYL